MYKSSYHNRDWVIEELDKTLHLVTSKLAEINKNEANTLSSQDIDNIKDIVEIIQTIRY